MLRSGDRRNADGDVHHRLVAGGIWMAVLLGGLTCGYVGFRRLERWVLEAELDTSLVV